MHILALLALVLLVTLAYRSLALTLWTGLFAVGASLLFPVALPHPGALIALAAGMLLIALVAALPRRRRRAPQQVASWPSERAGTIKSIRPLSGSPEILR